MSLIVLYCCPEHPDQVLFKEDLGQISLMVAERPATCPKCKKAYYKWECTTRNLNQG